MSQHQKHPKLPRPALGRYARSEFALVGTFCEAIHAIIDTVADRLADDYAVLRRKGAPGLFGNHDFDDRFLGNAYDLVLTNGNHFAAARQIVFVDARKAGTLERRREQLTDVALVVVCPTAGRMPSWLGELDVPHVELSGAADAIAELCRASAAAARPPLKALVLAGGKSSRMGEDKAELSYHGDRPEARRMYDLCRQAELETFLSVATADDDRFPELPRLADRFPGLGPFGAVLTALQSDPDAAWLVLSCDMPLFTAADLTQLIDARDARKYATALRDPAKPFPEPLAAIYEPRAYQRLLQFLSLGYACPRKMLINSEVAVVDLESGRAVTNVNTPGEREGVIKIIPGNNML